MTPAEAEALRFLQSHGLLDDPASARVQALTGGVSSDIFRVEAAGRSVVVKRALGRLRVAQEWQVPPERNAHEVAWLRRVATVVPDCVPQVLAHDPVAGMFAMAFMPPADYPVWKDELRAGRADPVFAAAVGRTLAAIHATTAAHPATSADFANQALFRAIRLEPYFEAAGRAHPDLADRLRALSEGLAASRLALVHGDVSPKNILCGSHGVPVFLDAECACCGDPAFDAAFCLNHLLLKCLLVPPATEALLASFDALAAEWLAGAAWENRPGLEARVAALLPALLLARVDGKSPVEYLSPAQQQVVRAFARTALQRPGGALAPLRDRWRETLAESAAVA